MNEQQILADVRQILRDKLGVRRPVEPQTQLFDDLELDSLQQLALVVELENHFRICFSPGEEVGVTSVADLVAVVGAAFSRGASDAER